MMPVFTKTVLSALLSCAVLISVMAHGAAAEEETQDQRRSLEVAGISASAGEDDPRILYILPWQTPSLPRRPRAELNQAAPELMQPVSTTALENHRQFRETLNPLVLEPALVTPALDKP
ncbi:MAG TPA: hypothetical protein VK006_08115 [Marinobacter sp.]|nr:hypothetical protein [Marinobacter sp.]